MFTGAKKFFLEGFMDKIDRKFKKKSYVDIYSRAWWMCGKCFLFPCEIVLCTYRYSYFVYRYLYDVKAYTVLYVTRLILD